jgi:hypothetical protein
MITLDNILIRTSQFAKLHKSCDSATLQELVDNSPIKDGDQHIRICEHGVSYVSPFGIYVKLAGQKTVIDCFDLDDTKYAEVYSKLGNTIVNLYVSSDHTKIEIDT